MSLRTYHCWFLNCTIFEYRNLFSSLFFPRLSRKFLSTAFLESFVRKRSHSSWMNDTLFFKPPPSQFYPRRIIQTSPPILPNFPGEFLHIFLLFLNFLLIYHNTRERLQILRHVLFILEYIIYIYRQILLRHC